MAAPGTGQGYDVIVVGAGSAGCVVANRLVTTTDARVLLLEAGGPDSLPAIHAEDMHSTMSLWGGGEFDWGYTSEPQPAMNNRTVPIARGKVWGGCSSINAMVYVRGNRADFDGWAARGNEGWSYDDVLPLFRRSEDFEDGESAHRGAGGPLSVRWYDTPSPVAERLFDATDEIGMAQRGRRFDYNAEVQEESPFFYQATKTRDHHRASTAVAFLAPVLDHANLTVASHALATRLLIDGGRVTGVEYRQDGRTVTARAEHEVIVCAGAFESPKLLMLSGLGPAGELGALGVDVVADLPEVGRNLQDHLIVGVCYLSRLDLPDPTLISETGFFHRTRPGGSPDVQMKFGSLKFVAPQYQQDGPGFTFAPVIVQPESVGTVSLRSADPRVNAVVQPNYLSDEADVTSFLEAIALSRELAATSAMAEFAKGEIAPGPDVNTRADLVDYVRANASTLWHPVGTCALGRVVDSQLRVFGVEGLRVADASVMPRIVTGNTNAASIMIGERVADLVRETYQEASSDV